MKNLAFGVLLLVCNLLMAQENKDVKKETKFQVGVHYTGNLRNGNNVSDGYNGILGISGSYTWYQKGNIALLGGINLDYLESRELFYTNNPILWNPNLGVELLLPKSQFKPYLNVGYAFFNAKFKVMPGLFNPNDSLNPFDPIVIDGSEITTTYNGISLQPGFKYMLSKGVFLEGSFQYFPAKSNDFDGIVNVHLVKIGVGVKL
ncbi:MAG: outer membrane beta-barrel protein [Flavobacterium sp.]|nr:outer membrane beta-barrel protein [Flavobacterium sp.]